MKKFVMMLILGIVLISTSGCMDSKCPHGTCNEENSPKGP